MADTEQYNGWANRETWAVAMHVNNDQGWQESVHEALRDAATLTRDGGPVWSALQPEAAGEVIRENVEDVLWPDYTEPLDNDAPRALALREIGSLWRVDWTELGAAFLADLAEYEVTSGGE